MLKTKESCEQQWHLVVEAEERRRNILAAHERQIGPEEIAIVVVTNQSFLSEELLPERLCVVSGIFWVAIGTDDIWFSPH